jgi:hydroxyethylthiazole kinase-like uncharacterized protein yjeF
MIPLFTSEQVRKADQFAIEKLRIPSIVLMENAARSILDAIEKNFENLNELTCFGIICGKGNNGGDGFALARQLLIRGYDVKVISIGKKSQLSGDSKVNFAVLEKLLIDYPNSSLVSLSNVSQLSSLKNCEIIVDAILGTGTKGNLKAPYESIIKKLNNLDAYKVAVDIPTGLIEENATGNLIFDADLTVTLGELKAGLYYGQGYIKSGKKIKGSIGIGSEYFDKQIVHSYLVEPEDTLLGLPVRRKAAHKYSTGKVLIIAGSHELPGAAILSAKSALRSGAGAVILAAPKSISQIAQSKLDEAVVISYNDKGKGYLSTESLSELEERINWADCVILGPGLGRSQETIKAVQNIVLKHPAKKFVIDADALYAISTERLSKFNLENCVLTPHFGEFANLLNVKVSELQNNIISFSQKFAEQNKCFLLLKGAPTILFTPDSEVLINTSGNQALAKFGSGDVLSGILGAFISANKELENSVLAGTYIHGICADILINRLNELSVNATDLIDTISDAINFIRKSFI